MNGKYLVGFYVWAVFSCSCVWDLHTCRPAPFTPLKTQEFHTHLPFLLYLVFLDLVLMIECPWVLNHEKLQVDIIETSDWGSNKHEKNKTSQSMSTLLQFLLEKWFPVYEWL